MKKLLILLSVVLVACEPTALEKEKAMLSQADFPSVVTQVSEKTESKGKYQIRTKRVDGTEYVFTSNIKYNLHDTLTIGVDTTHAFNKVASIVIPDRYRRQYTGVRTSLKTDSIITDSTKIN